MRCPKPIARPNHTYCQILQTILKKIAFNDIATKLILDEWQVRWDNSPDSILKKIYPNIKHNVLPQFYNSRKINRLRYGKTTLNKGQTLVGIGKDCIQCGVPLDIGHLLLSCNLPLKTELKNYCNSHKIDHNLYNILTNKGCILIILAAI